MVRKSVKRSPSEAKSMVQTALWLPRDMHERLKVAGGERGLGEEIRRRLEASFSEDQADPGVYGWVDPKRDKSLGQVIGILAGRIEEIGPMTDDRKIDRDRVLAMLKVAIADLLDRLGAKDDLMLPQDKTDAAFLARQMANEIFRSEQVKPLAAQPYKEYFAEVFKAWGFKADRGE
jgi:hypothetical protein